MNMGESDLEQETHSTIIIPEQDINGTLLIHQSVTSQRGVLWLSPSWNAHQYQWPSVPAIEGANNLRAKLEPPKVRRCDGLPQGPVNLTGQIQNYIKKLKKPEASRVIVTGLNKRGFYI